MYKLVSRNYQVQDGDSLIICGGASDFQVTLPARPNILQKLTIRCFFNTITVTVKARGKAKQLVSPGVIEEAPIKLDPILNLETPGSSTYETKLGANSPFMGIELVYVEGGVWIATGVIRQDLTVTP